MGAFTVLASAGRDDGRMNSQSHSTNHRAARRSALAMSWIVTPHGLEARWVIEEPEPLAASQPLELAWFRRELPPAA